jgi:hypothetical protein
MKIHDTRFCPLHWILLIGCSLTATINAAEAPANNEPIASGADYLLQPGTSGTITLEASDVDEDALSYIITDLPSKGTIQADGIELNADLLPYTLAGGGNTVTYDTKTDDSGTYTLKFKADDGTAQSTEATINITVNQRPLPTHETFFTRPNEDLDFELPVTDDGTGTLTFTITTLPGHGRIKFGQEALTDSDVPFETDQSDLLYSPDEDYHGPDKFDVTASDGYATSPTITVSIEVNTTPVPETLDITVPPNDETTINLQCVEADLDPVRYILASLPAHGQLSVLGTTVSSGDIPLVLDHEVSELTYTVDTDYRGTDSFHYRVRDSVSISDRAIVKITVNTPPVVDDQEHTLVPTETKEIILSPRDADGDDLTIRISQLPEYGRLAIDGSTVTSTDNSYPVQDEDLAVTYTPETTVEPEPSEETTEESEADTETTSEQEQAENETETQTPDPIDQRDSFSWIAEDDKDTSSEAKVDLHIIEQEANSDNESEEEPSETVACGAMSGEMLLMVCLMFIAPCRRFFRFS